MFHNFKKFLKYFIPKSEYEHLFYYIRIYITCQESIFDDFPFMTISAMVNRTHRCGGTGAQYLSLSPVIRFFRADLHPQIALQNLPPTPAHPDLAGQDYQIQAHAACARSGCAASTLHSPLLSEWRAGQRQRSEKV